MRIIAGKYKHRLINYPENNKDIRPTKDRVREAIFSALGDISGKTVVDLYAGSGAMGIEALSRNASYAIFNDISKLSIDVVKANLSSLGIDNAIYKISYAEDFNLLNSLDKKYDIYFIDPPYKKGQYEKLINVILEKDIVSDNGILVIEYDTEFSFDESKFRNVKSYKYGDIMVKILWK